MPHVPHVLSVHDFSAQRVKRLFARAQEMRRIISRKHARCSILEGSIMGTVFYEASTRTRFSFEAAMLRLGGQVITTENAAQFSSATKGESLADSIRTMGCYLDLIVLRHFTEGAATIAAKASSVPIINGGDGSGEHPTQALLDLFTIQEERGDLSQQHVVFVGDLKHGRTVHSLARLLGMYNTTLSFVSPESLCLPDALFHGLSYAGCTIQDRRRLEDVIGDADVIYMTRVQKERLAEATDVATDGSDYALTEALVKYLNPHAIVMHPFPRNSEIPTWFDADPRAAYFRQIQNGLYIRMALLEELLNPPRD
jgi:aspartate carbamoyltransferase catalytic subunit